jgi:hypothetical protein
MCNIRVDFETNYKTDLGSTYELSHPQKKQYTVIQEMTKKCENFLLASILNFVLFHSLEMRLCRLY